MDWKTKISEQAEKMKNVSLKSLGFTTEQKNNFLLKLYENIEKYRDSILRSNSRDVNKARESNLPEPFIDRLALTNKRVDKMLEAIGVVTNLPDPVGVKIWETDRPNGLHIERVRVPIGVIGIIYESRPDVTIEASILCIKAGNCVVLRGGKEAKYSNSILVEILKESLVEVGLPADMVNLVSVGGRKSVRYLLSLSEYIDLIIPRGGESLIETVVQHSRIPVIKHYKGVCHTYIDKYADIDMALKVAVNAKIQRPSTCNATETLLVHKDVSKSFIPAIMEIFMKEKVEVKGCKKTLKIVSGIKEATDKDWEEEYLSMKISIKIVDSIEDAIEHINRYGTSHSEAIVTSCNLNATKFLKEVDASAVFHNASTRFTDGGEFGLGAEIGISTDKIHARGPMGLEELTSYKYLIYGYGQLRQ
ncbi:glutamate-5-semialdehyde dehydrogenase [bacterium]|nr:glutamate-5-semialdehyde dehydrogenase [bacterium]